MPKKNALSGIPESRKLFFNLRFTDIFYLVLNAKKLYAKKSDDEQWKSTVGHFL